MAGFFERVKAFFSSDGSSGLGSRVSTAMRARAARGESFNVADLAAELGVTPVEVQPLAEQWFAAGLLASQGYVQLGVFFTPQPPGAAVPPPMAGASPRGASAAAPPMAPSMAPRRVPGQPGTAAPATSYAANPEIMGLSAEAHRQRALTVVPWRTAWIGRTDTIPPQSDERTALIDRGLELGGYLTPEQLTQVHRVGDEWLRHHEAEKLARSLAHASGQAAVEALRVEKARVRAEKKQASLAQATARAEGVARRRREDIIFLGRGVSRGLADRRADVERLRAHGLPVLSTPADVATALGLSVRKLRWLCFHSEAAQRVHYTAFEIPKRSGGTRRLAAPHQTLKAAQTRVLHDILEKVPLGAPAHGFVKGRSTVTNARAHLKQGVVVNLDVKDFFPSIGFRRVRGVFEHLGYSPAVATVLALLCTEAPRRPVEYAGVTYHVALGERALPQGACTSPALSNLISRRLDRRLSARLGRQGWTYTRYADDLTFSSKEAVRTQVGRVMATVRHVVQEEGFALNPKKGRVQVQAGRQLVTGLVVNEKPAVPREVVRRLRAILHQAQRTGLEAQNKEQRPNFRQWLEGMISYVSMVDAEKGRRLRAALEKVKA